jgi:hypothetical protein
MISKNIDFYREKDLFTNYEPPACNFIPNQLAVSRISGQANINYGEICDGLYLKTFETGAIKMKQGNGADSFLSFSGSEKNLVPFSFDKGQILVLTCSLAFLGSVNENGSQVQPQILTSFKGVVDCFFQEKSEDDIIDGYFTDTKGFRKIDEEEPIKIFPDGPLGEEKTCTPCPIYSYDIDIPIYGNGVQYRNGPISLSLVGPSIEAGEFAANVITCGGGGGGGGGGGAIRESCPCEFDEESRNLKWVSYIYIEEHRVRNDN